MKRLLIFLVLLTASPLYAGLKEVTGDSISEEDKAAINYNFKMYENFLRNKIDSRDFNVIIGTMSSRTSTGNSAITTGFKPRLVFIWTEYVVAGGIAVQSKGFMTSTRQWASGLRHEAGANYPSRNNITSVISTPTNTGAALLEASFVSMDTTGFTINFTTVEASARDVFYMAIQ